MDVCQILMYFGVFLVTVVMCMTVSYLIEIRRKWRFRILMLCGCHTLIFMIIYIGDLDNLPPTLLFFLFCVWNACHGSKLKRLTIGLMLASIMFALNALFDNCVAFYLHEWMGDKYTIPHFFYRALVVVLLHLGIRQYKPERDFELTPPLWRLLLVLCMPTMGIVCSLVLLNRNFYIGGLDREYILVYTVLLLVAALAFVGILWAMLVFYRQQKLEREYALVEYNQKYYETMEQHQFEIRRMKHDLANHLQVLLSLSADEKDSYIQKMIENPVFEKVLAYSGDTTVNAVLTAKESMMRQREISFSAKVDIPEELPFEKPDLCALFANALDNAAEGCGKLATAKRQVELTARGKGIFSSGSQESF